MLSLTHVIILVSIINLLPTVLSMVLPMVITMNDKKQLRLETPVLVLGYHESIYEYIFLT